MGSRIDPSPFALTGQEVPGRDVILAELGRFLADSSPEAQGIISVGSETDAKAVAAWIQNHHRTRILHEENFELELAQMGRAFQEQEIQFLIVIDSGTIHDPQLKSLYGPQLGFYVNLNPATRLDHLVLSLKQVLQVNSGCPGLNVAFLSHFSEDELDDAIFFLRSMNKGLLFEKSREARLQGSAAASTGENSFLVIQRIFTLAEELKARQRYRSFAQFIKWWKSEGLRTQNDFANRKKVKDRKAKTALPSDIPLDPVGFYRLRNWYDITGNEEMTMKLENSKTLAEFKQLLKDNQIKSARDFEIYFAKNHPKGVPSRPTDHNWPGGGAFVWSEFTGRVSSKAKADQFKPFQEFLDWARVTFSNRSDFFRRFWRMTAKTRPEDIPSRPELTYGRTVGFPQTKGALLDQIWPRKSARARGSADR